ncbi:septum formation protein [Pelomyxa schiedti]|nr:septum formation protein [Pelomyxa schiedti]
MIIEYLALLRRKRIVLASASPRRLEAMKIMGLVVDVVPSRFDETLDKKSFASCLDYVSETAWRKGLEVYQRLGDALPDLIISADTIVDVDGEIVEKPTSHANAVEILMKLSGKTHRVHTAVCLILPPQATSTTTETTGAPTQAMPQAHLVRRFTETTEVTFDAITPEMAKCYADTGSPMDKAGGYGIQELGTCFIKGISGCYWNVTGLPIQRLCKELLPVIKEFWL